MNQKAKNFAYLIFNIKLWRHRVFRANWRTWNDLFGEIGKLVSASDFRKDDLLREKISNEEICEEFYC